jgi:hypothetical protein
MKLTGAPLSVAGVANSPPIPTDTRTLTAGVGVSVTTTSASTTYQVQISLDDPYSAAGVVNWFTPAAGQFTGILSGAIVAAGTYVGQITTFCTAVRLQVTVNAGTPATILAWQSDNTLGA